MDPSNHGLAPRRRPPEGDNIMLVDSHASTSQPFPFSSGNGRFGTASPNLVSNPKEAIIKCPRCSSENTKFCYYNNYSLSQPRHFCKNCRRYWTRGGALRNVPVGGVCRKKLKPKTSSSHRLGPIEESTEAIGALPIPTSMPLSTPPYSSTSCPYMFIQEPTSSYLRPPLFSHVNLARDSVDASQYHGDRDGMDFPMEFVPLGQPPSYDNIHMPPPSQPFSLTLAGGLNNFATNVNIDPEIQWNQSSKHHKIEDPELHWSQSTQHKRAHFDDTLAPNPAGELLSLMSEHDMRHKSFKQYELSSTLHLKTSSDNGSCNIREGGRWGLFDQHPPTPREPWNNGEWLDVSGYPLPNRPQNSSS